MKHYNHLLEQDRSVLQQLFQSGIGITEIARRLGRHRSTLYREIKRNKSRDGYLSYNAERMCRKRLHNERVSKIARYLTLRTYVNTALKRGWSPEQICGRLKRKKSKYAICRETIYRYIYQHPEKKLYQYLRYKNPRRHKRSVRIQQQCRFGEKRLITGRPTHIKLRKHWGHWEGDSIEFCGNRNNTVTTLVERKSRLVFLIKNTDKKSETVMENIKAKMTKLPRKLCQTITFDQGMEFANPGLLERAIRCRIYYCHAHAPWEKGSNENTNGRLRRYLPHETDIDEFEQEHLDDIANMMNTTPRKCLAYRTPNELFSLKYKSTCRT